MFPIQNSSSAKRNPFISERKTTLALLLAIALGFSGCGVESPDTLNYTGSTMGTYYSVKVIETVGDGEARIDRERLGHDVERILGEINALMSTYREDSELSRFNASTGTDWFPVSEDLFTVANEALKISRLSGGAFDITVGPLVNLWGFGPSKGESPISDLAVRSPADQDIRRSRPHSPPAPRRESPVKDSAVRSTLARIGYEKVHVRAAPPAIRKDHPGIYLDLSAIAKGFAVDKIAEYLLGKGITRYLVDIGGELRCLGKNAGDKPWRVAIEEPTPGERAAHKVVAVDGHAVATSGDYRNFFERDGKRYSHTIDPGTGRPVTHNLVSVTVIDPSAMRADALATALSVLGPEAGYELAVREGIPAWLITRTGTGFADRHTPGFEKFVVR